eukprot:GHRR01027279.1.p1 GENE.GHRR01027279.1~~GHRR01027279.1.p1  ORF type:complete len:429 (+),score=150.18 GHRR01027279.1:1037-2323(+)
MYSPYMQLSNLNQEVLLKLLLLADRFQASSIAAAAAAALGKIKASEMDWQLVISLHGLPVQLQETLQAWPGFAQARKAAGASFQAKLGDLDAVWQQPATAACLLHLPQPLLLQLLSDPCTRAASEDTAVFTVDRWLQRNTVPEQQVRQLVQQIRLPHCSPLFLSTVVPNTGWLLQHIPASDLLIAAALGMLSCPDPASDALETHSDTVIRHLSWLLPARLQSAVNKLQIDLHISLQQLKELVQRSLVSGSQPAAVRAANQMPQGEASSSASSHLIETSIGKVCFSDVRTWHGRSFCLKLHMGNDTRLAVTLLMLSSTAGMRQAGSGNETGGPRSSSGSISNSIDDGPLQHELAAVQCSVCAVRFGVQELCQKPTKPRTFAAGAGVKWGDFFGLGRVSCWQDVLRGLQRRHMAVGHAGIHIRAVVTKLW